jgi:hypothetical protein
MIDSSDDLRTLEEIFQPDPRSGANALAQKRTLEIHRNEVAELVLHDGVPEDIRVQFLTACNVLLYGWFVFRFLHVAELHALATLELALKHRLGPATPEQKRSPGLRGLLDAAVDQGLVRASGLRGYQRRVVARAQDQEERRLMYEAFDRAIATIPGAEPRVPQPEPEPVADEVIMRRLAKGLPKWRNELAHGSTLLFTEGVLKVELCADLINQLFERPAT